MTQDELKPLLALLRALPSKQTWEPAHVQVYGMVLLPLAYDVGLAAVSQAVAMEEWRPAPARLRRVVANLLSPLPSDEATYAEICYKAGSIGLYGRQTGRNWWEEEPPPMSHPVVSLSVAYCGGWRAICTGEAQMQEGLRKQVRNGHELAAAEWSERVLEQLRLPIECRNPLVCGPDDKSRFRVYPVYELPLGYLPDSYGPDLERLPHLRLERERDKAKALPSDVRQQLIDAGMMRLCRPFSDGE